MDLREYEYITRRPDTFPLETLKASRGFLDAGVAVEAIEKASIRLIDKVIKEGHLEPPKEYKWHGFYQVALTTDEIKKIVDDLMLVAQILKDHPSFPKNKEGYIKRIIESWNRCIYEPIVSYEEVLKKQVYYDLRNATLAEFEKFLFDHPVADREKKEDPWDWDSDLLIDFEADYVAELYIQLFRDSGGLLDHFTTEELDQGLWAAMGSNLECSAYNLIWDRGIPRKKNGSIPLTKKEELIGAMSFLYENLFSVEPLGISCNMWWDAFAFEFHCDEDDEDDDLKNNQDRRRIQNAMFDVLKKILALDSEFCQGAALHGLGHLRHPETEAIISEYLNRNKSLDKETIAYAKACISGDIM